MGVTKYILKHPVTTVMALLCLVVFGISSVFSAKLEQMPDMETPMLIIMANYSGAGPEDISELVTEPIEDAIGTLEGVDTITSKSSDGRSELAGVHLSFEEGRGKQRISCIATAYHEFIRLGPELYIESLDVLLNAWDGEPDSMSSANLLGICRFVELYHSEYSKSRLIAKLRQVDAFTIFRLARTAGVSLPGKTKYLQQVYTIYNGGSRRAALPLKF